MDAPGGGTQPDADLIEAVRLLESQLVASLRQFERVKRLMRLQRTRTAAMPEQPKKR